MHSEKERSTASKKGFYGWVIVAISHLTIMVVFGVRLSFTVFFVALIEEYGWSRADTSLIFSTSMIVFAATSTLVGIALDKWGSRRVFGIGAVILAIGLLLSSQVQDITQLAIAYGGIAGLGITILGLAPIASLIARWFKRRRGLAIGIAFAGTGVGTFLIVPGVEYLISMFDWRTAYIALAGLTLAIFPLIVILFRQNPSEKGFDIDGETTSPIGNNPTLKVREWTFAETIRTPTFWLLILASLGAIGPIRMLTVHQLAKMVEVGFERSFAAEVIGVSGVITALTFILSGSMSDKIDRRLIYGFGSLTAIMAIFILNGLENSGQSAWLWVYALLLGLGEGSRSSLITAFASDLFPGNALGAVNGAVGASFGMGAAIFPWLAGLFYDLQNTYSTGFMVSVIAVIISTFSLWLAPLFVSSKSKPGIT